MTQQIGIVKQDGTVLLKDGRAIQWLSPDPQWRQKIGLRFNGGSGAFGSIFNGALEKKPPLSGKQ